MALPPEKRRLNLGDGILSRAVQNAPAAVRDVGRDASLDLGPGIASRVTAAGVDAVPDIVQTAQNLSRNTGGGLLLDGVRTLGQGLDAAGRGIGNLFSQEGGVPEAGIRPGPPQAPGVNGGNVPASGATGTWGPNGATGSWAGGATGTWNAPALAPPTPALTPNAISSAVQAGGDAAGMGYWQAGDGPRNYIPGTQAVGSSLSTVGTGNSPGMPAFTRAAGPSPGPAPTGILPPGGATASAAPQNGGGVLGAGTGPRPGTAAPTSGGGGGGVSTALQQAMANYQALPAGGGSEGSRRRQQAYNVMNALAGVEERQVSADATLGAAGIGANSQVQTTGMNNQTDLNEALIQQSQQAQEAEIQRQFNEGRLGIMGREMSAAEAAAQPSVIDQLRQAYAIQAFTDPESVNPLVSNVLNGEPINQEIVGIPPGSRPAFQSIGGQIRPLSPIMEETLLGIGAR